MHHQTYLHELFRWHLKLHIHVWVAILVRVDAAGSPRFKMTQFSKNSHFVTTFADIFEEWQLLQIQYSSA